MSNYYENQAVTGSNCIGVNFCPRAWYLRRCDTPRSRVACSSPVLGSITASGASRHAAGLLWSKSPMSSNKTIRNQIECTAVAIASTGSFRAKGRIKPVEPSGGGGC